MLSYWEKKHFVKYDFIIVGAGITGLSTAIELAEKYPQQRIVVLERGILPTGASTRNAGFACMGSLSELMDDIDNSSEAESLALYEARLEGLQILRARLGDDKIGFRMDGGYELLMPHEMNLLSKIEYLNNLLYPLMRQEVFSYKPNTINELGFNTQHIAAVISNHVEGSIDTGLMMKNLLRLSLLKGVEVKTGMNVVGFEDGAHQVTVQCNTLYNLPFEFEAAHLILCTNAFTKYLWPQASVQPGRGQVLITNPIHCLHLKGIYHFDQGYYYFREIDGRILFGGGRNLDFDGEATTEIALNDKFKMIWNTS